MKKFVISMLLAATATALVVDAVAKPMGGGRSIGRQSPTVTRQAPQPAPQQAPLAGQRQAAPAAAAPAPAAPVQKPSMWKGVLGGALLGLGLGALFSSLGMGAGMANALGSILMIGLLVAAAVFLFRLLRGKSQQAQPAGAAPYAYGAPAPTPEIGSRLEPAAFQGGAAAAAAAPVSAPWGVPAGFDTDGFLREAKASFLRMQAAWDKGDAADLREFVTPEVFGELRLQLQERAAGESNFTDVVTLNAELLGVETLERDYVASVKFDATIKQSENGPAEPFCEVWNMTRAVAGGGRWILAGIQQVQ
ncbi:Tim44 domain-containing protein [Massilia sp. TS11]|uniref:Tim44 domain-containing protein n=1 Tax=Massilia sp. TS11 TaxID=2908003 RepID=UPI001EDBB81D|nr:Tim44-like domain-containing protein [Massilia sp. TS11]MCG2584979.1 Tim44-like domain-containing protein [Massilia sp. TS11]